MEQASSPRYDHVLLSSDFKCTKNHVPGGTKGDLMQSYYPKRQAYADRLGFNPAARKRFKVISDCSSS